MNTTPRDPQTPAGQTTPDEFDLDELCALVTAHGVPAYVEQTGGGVATLLVGTPTWDARLEEDRFPIAAGPGWFTGPAWTDPRASFEEFCYGPDDQGLSEVVYVHVMPLAELATAIVAAHHDQVRQLTSRGRSSTE